MKKGYLYRIVAITLAFAMLGVAILVPLGQDGSNRIWLIVVGSIFGVAYIGALVWSLIDYGRKNKKKDTDN